MGQDIANMRAGDPAHPDYDRQYGTLQNRAAQERIAALEEMLERYHAATHLFLETLDENAHPYLIKNARMILEGKVDNPHPFQAALQRMTDANAKNLARADEAERRLAWIREALIREYPK